MIAETKTAPTVRAGLLCRCPRCGEGALYKSVFSLTVRDRCDACGLDYGFIDSGDGPAVFVILLLGFLVMGAALIVEFKLAPPIWVHLVLWPVVTGFLGLAMLRPMKATLIALQYRNKAEEGRLAGGDET
jgi:uncharacterized protein (DUF983 family)